MNIFPEVNRNALPAASSTESVITDSISTQDLSPISTDSDLVLRLPASRDKFVSLSATSPSAWDDLSTPVPVVRTYCQSVFDGFIDLNCHSSMPSIEEGQELFKRFLEHNNNDDDDMPDNI